jgi:ParB-like chromosome segregation protein Spo0J
MTTETEIKVRNYPEVKVKIEDLKFDSSNPNKTPPRVMEGTRQSIKKFGFVKPIVINENYEIADGEHRAIVMRELGEKEISAYIVPTLNDDIARRLARQTLNKLHGEHDRSLDIDELSMILETSADDLKQILDIDENKVAEMERLLEAESSAVRGVIDDEEGGKSDIDDPLPTMNRCPQCGFKW